MNLPDRQISRYHIRRQLGEGGMSMVYEGQTDAGERAAIKVLKAEVTSHRTEDIIRFQREAGAVSRLEHPHLVKVLEAGQAEGLPYIAMELVDGIGLDADLRARPERTVEEILEIIYQLAETLVYVHGKGIVHRDLKPGNVMLVHRADGVLVKVLDFGLAEMLEMDQIREKETIVGTFSYMSPEQSGIVKKPVDERSDLYSLGVIFYELATGKKPFEAGDLAGLLHRQAAQKPMPPGKLRRDLPSLLEEIILKLLHKDPDDRYQGAKGLVDDLTRFRKGESDFPLASSDRRGRLTFRTRLVGREEEMRNLEGWYREAAQGKGSVCLIGGEAGRGKSRLIGEFRDFVVREGGMFLEGKCFSQENKTPYQPFVEALTVWIGRLKNLPSVEREARILRVKASAGELGEIICSLNPLLREVLGKVPALVPLDLERENRRFLMVGSRFFRNLGVCGNPAVLYLDDLHWSDEGSLNLLAEILSEVQDSPLLVLGAYRDNEVGEEHALTKILRRTAPAPYKLQLENLSPERINGLVARLLSEVPEQIQKLGDYVYQKSRGNPFFAIEVVRHLVEEKVLIRDDVSWCVDWEKLAKAAVPDTMLEVLIRRIQDLPCELEELLKVASVVGRTFTLEMLYPLVKHSPEEVVRQVDEAIGLQILEQDEEQVLFCHERIRAAFHHTIDPVELSALHRLIAETLEALYRNDVDSILYDLAHHWIEAGDREKSLLWSLPAARKAKQGYANQEAVRYYKTAVQILNEKWRGKSAECVAAEKELVDVYLAMGQSDEAIALSQYLLLQEPDRLERARLQRRIGRAYFKKGDWANCEENLIRGLGLLNERVPRTLKELVPALLKELCFHFLTYFMPKKLFLAKAGQTALPQEINQIYSGLNWVYALSDGLKLSHCAFRMLNIAALKIPDSDEYAMALTFYGMFWMVGGMFNHGSKIALHALALRTKANTQWGIAQTEQLIGFSHQYRSHWPESMEFAMRSAYRFEEIGDMYERNMCIQVLGMRARFISDYKAAQMHFQEYTATSRKIGDNFGIAGGLAHVAHFQVETGDYENAEKRLLEAIEISEKKELYFIEAFSRIAYGRLLLETGRYAEARHQLHKAGEIDKKYNFIQDHIVQLFCYQAELAMAQYLKFLQTGALSPAEQSSRLKEIKVACRTARMRCRMWTNHVGSAARVTAQYLALAEKKRQAEKWFLKSLRQTEAAGRRFELGRSLYEYARFLESMGRAAAAQEHLQKAEHLFRKIGAKVWAERSAQALGLPAQAESSRDRLAEKLEFASVVGVSQNLSAILDLEVLLEKIMDAALEVTGAERGILYLFPQGGGEAERKVIRSLTQSEDGKDEPVSRTILKKVEESREALLVVDASRDLGLEWQASVVAGNLRSVLCAPLIFREKLLGLIYLDNRLVAGLFTAEKLEILKMLTAQAAISLENAWLYREVQDKARMEQELQVGREIQKGLLPLKMPEVSGLKMAGLMLPAKEIGGDYYDYLIKTETGSCQTLSVVVGDVSGKGVGAGMVMATAKAILHSLHQDESGPKKLLVQLNEVMCRLVRGEKMMTMLCLRWEQGNKKMRWCSAGHEPILIWRRGRVTEARGKGFMLGMSENVDEMLEENELETEPGDKLLLYTDGVTDARNPSEDFYSSNQLIAALEKNGHQTVEDLIGSLQRDILEFAGAADPFDDITLVALEVL